LRCAGLGNIPEGGVRIGCATYVRIVVPSSE
jgi:hypothetical protein